jgi:hypothetical protein
MIRITSAILLFLSFHSPAQANTSINPPEDLTSISYPGWLRAINSNVSAFADNAFAWYEAQKKSPLPSQVYADPDSIYVDVDRALQETIALEQSGDIEEGNTIGFDAYALINAPIQVVLETKLFNWGKPVGQPQGETYPYDSVFSLVHDVSTLRWGANNFWVTTSQTGGGVAQDLHDDYTILVRGNSTRGYSVFASYFGPEGDTATQAHISIVILTPTANGKTEYRQCVRQNGQSYKIFGIDIGRKSFGFNAARDHDGVKLLSQQMLELKSTGTIKQNKPNGFLY